MPQVEIAPFDTNAREDHYLTDRARVGSIARLCRRRRLEFENGAHTTFSEIGPVG